MASYSVIQVPQVPYQKPVSGTFSISEADEAILDGLRVFYSAQNEVLTDQGLEIRKLDPGTIVDVSGKVICYPEHSFASSSCSC